MNKLKDLRISKMKFGVTGISFFVFSTCLSMSSGNNLRVSDMLVVVGGFRIFLTFFRPLGGAK